MSIAELIPLIESLPRGDKLRLMQVLLSTIACDEGIVLEDDEPAPIGQGKSMAAALQRMTDRNALPSIADPAAWRKEIRSERVLPGRE